MSPGGPPPGGEFDPYSLGPRDMIADLLSKFAPEFDRSAPPPVGAAEAAMQKPFPATKWDDLVRQGDPATLGICDPERAADVTETDLIDLVTRSRDESSRSRSLHEGKWRWLEDAYFLHGAGGEKKDWQSEIQIPEVYNKIRVALSLIQGALGGGPRYFDLVGVREIVDDEQIRFITRWLDYVARNARLLDGLLVMWEEAFLLGTGCLRISVDETIEYRPSIVNAPLYQDPMQQQQAMMQGMATSQAVIDVEPRQRTVFKVEKVPIWAMYPDPFAKDFYSCTYVVEEAEVDEGTLKERHKAGIYDSLDDIGEPVSLGDDSIGGADYERKNQTSTIRRRHLVQEYTGNIYDRTGHLIAKNWIITVVNKRSVVRVGPNPVWSGKSRYIWSTPIPREGSIWGRSLVEADASVQREMENLLNLMLDDVKYAVLGAFQVDETQSDEPSDITSIEPGRIYRGRGEFVRKLMFGTNIAQAWPVLNYLQGVGDRSTQISEFVDGSPSSRGRPTATEVSSKTQAGQQYMHNLSRRIEDNDVERAVALLYELLMQFGSDTSEPELGALLEAWGGPNTLADQVQRFQALDAPFKIQVRGISMVMRREETVGRLMQVMQLSQQIGAPAPNLLEMLYAIIAALGFTPEQLGYPSSSSALQQQMLAEQMQQQAMGKTGGGGAPVAGGSGSTLPGGGPPMAPPPPGI